MTLKLESDLDILIMYLHTENEVARLMHSKLLTLDEICMATPITSEMKNTQMALKVKDQGQMSLTFNHF